MKKHRWFAVISAMVMALAFAGCQINSDNHEHSFSKDWTSDATDHWHAATCEHTKEVSDKAAHTFGDYVSNNDATTESDGTKTRKCSVCGYEDTVTDEGSKIVATPAFSVESGAVNSGTEVTISCATDGAKIYYTKDGSNPTASSTEYTAAISVTEAVTLKAIAVKDGMNDSAVESVSYTIKETVATPAFSVESGAVNSGTSVTITCSTDGAKIYYTTDEKDPTASSTEYTGAISVTPPMTLKAIAVKSGMNNSSVASASYLIIPTKATCVPGDFVLKDGTMLPKDITLTDTQKSNVAAVIVRAAADGKPALGVGIVHNQREWCTSSATGYNTEITALRGDKTSGYMDGSDGWEKLKAACSDAESNPENYPAWNYSLTYATTNNLTGDLAEGWYLPTMAELYTIYQNKNAVNESLSKAGGSTFGTSWNYWSCRPVSGGYAQVLNFANGEIPSFYDKYNDDFYVCSVRAFN